MSVGFFSNFLYWHGSADSYFLYWNMLFLDMVGKN